VPILFLYTLLKRYFKTQEFEPFFYPQKSPVRIHFPPCGNLSEFWLSSETSVAY
jgi:hypothetical protein